MKSKMEPATNKIKRLLEIFSSYSFNLYDPHEIIPISFNIREILQENYHNIIKDTYMVQRRLQAKA